MYILNETGQKYNIYLNSDRSEQKIDIIRQYLKATQQLRDYANESQDPQFTQVRNSNPQQSYSFQ